LKRILHKTILQFTVLVLLVVICIGITSQREAPSKKQKGAHVFGHLDSINLQPFVKNNYNWITLVPFSGQNDVDSPSLVYHRRNRLESTHRDSVWRAQIVVAHAMGFKVFLKPHIWIHSPKEGKWRSDIYPTSEVNWESWKKEYRDFILLYAKIAEESGVELFCIGTELSRLSVEKPEFWKSLIKDVRNIYSGKLTYAANWMNEFEQIQFWDDLDYIGIQAYFPLTKHTRPSVEQISEGWKKYLPSMELIHEKFHKKILFTEMGYKSTADSAIKPWQWIENYENHKDLVSYETQANCYKAFFNEVWDKEWFEGVHIWQLRSDYVAATPRSDLDFTPQGKPAEVVIAKAFE
jgi:hypothetical protein